MATQPSKTPTWQANNLGEVNKYGGPPNNGNRQPLGQTNTISTQDYTGRGDATLGENAQADIVGVQAARDANASADLLSPQTLSASVTTLVIPPKAVNVTLISTATFSFAEYWSGSGALTQYVAWPANTPVTIETARISRLYLSGTAACSFFFSIM